MKLSRRTLTSLIGGIALLSVMVMLAIALAKPGASTFAAAPKATAALSTHGHVAISQSGTQVIFTPTTLTLMHNTLHNTSSLYFVNTTTTVQTVVGPKQATYTVDPNGGRRRVNLPVGTYKFTLKGTKGAVSVTVTVK